MRDVRVYTETGSIKNQWQKKKGKKVIFKEATGKECRKWKVNYN